MPLPLRHFAGSKHGKCIFPFRFLLNGRFFRQLCKQIWLPFWLGIIGYLLVIALPDRGNTPKAVSDELPDL